MRDVVLIRLDDEYRSVLLLLHDKKCKQISGGVKLVLSAQTSTLSEMIQ
jgi:hypothetical protein